MLSKSVILSVLVSVTAAVGTKNTLQAIISNASNGPDALNPSEGGDVPSGFCDDVHSVAGYFGIGQKKRYFYWAFESRGDPANDPVILWQTGGPGCSSQLALLKENGPCKLNDDMKTTHPNPYSWNKNANIIFIDQPAGVGFSTGDVDDTGEWDVAPEMVNFLEAFFETNHHLQKNKFYIFGESYGGHYVPSLASEILVSNKAKKEGEVKINLVGVGIGNGLTNPSVQYAEYPKYAYKNKYHQVVGKFGYYAMNAAKGGCVGLINKCNNGSPASCTMAMEVCNMAFMGPITLQGLNQYDIREKCKFPPLCYDFAPVSTFLNDPETKKILNVEGNKDWESCNAQVSQNFITDYMVDVSPNVTMLLEEDIDVLIYAGEADYICNWMGNLAWTLALPWTGHDEYNAAEVKDWMFNETVSGTVRSYKNFKFLTIADAGHMVPLDKPEAALFMLDEYLNGNNNNQ